MTHATRFALSMVYAGLAGFVGVLEAAVPEMDDPAHKEHTQKAAGYLRDALYRLDLVPGARTEPR